MTPVERFIKAAQHIEKVRANYTSLHSSKSMKPTEFSYAYQGLYLILIRKFENYLEDSFFHYASGGSCPPRIINGSTRRIKILTKETRRENLRSLLLGDKKFLDFLPFELTEKCAKVVFDAGFPFTILPRPDKEVIQRCLAIRNLIAHDSIEAKKRFRTLAIVDQSLSGRNKNVMGYLTFPVSTVSIMFTVDISELIRIARAIAG